jgi:D-sedoheptulose 7-phosphate isomerase
MIESIRRIVDESTSLKRSFFAANDKRIAALAEAVCAALKQGKKLLLYGNGGSAADAQHIAAELVGTFQRDRKPLPAVALTTDSSILTSIANDLGYENVFARQIDALGRPGDVSIAISTSGNSPNVLAGSRAASSAGLVTVGLTGRDGGGLGPLVEHHLNVPHASTARVQEIHIMIGHILCELVEENLKGRD